MVRAVKLDEDLSPLVAEPLLAGGYTTTGVVEQGWGGLKDGELWERVCAEGVFFVTADKGFGDVRAFPPGTHGGVLMLRPDRESLVEFRALVVAVLASYHLESLVGTITVASPRSIRVRRAAT